MGKYKTTRECIHSVNGAKDPHELRRVLQKHYPDAFIDWTKPVATVGDIFIRNADSARYKLVKTADGKAAFLNIQNSTLWKNFSTEPVMPFDAVSLQSFMEITNGMRPDRFHVEKPKRAVKSNGK
jgi:hypothetical protein